MKKAKNLLRLSAYLLISALFIGFGNGILRAQNQFVKITSLDELKSDAEYLMVYEKSATEAIYASTYSSSKYTGTSVSISNGIISLPDDVCTFTFTQSGANWKMYDNIQKSYIAYNSSTNFKLGDGTWTITKQESGFQIVATTSTTRYILYSTSNSKFGPYASSNLGNQYFLVNLYKKQDAPSCGQVSDVKTELSSYNTVKLSWTAPATAPANGYKVSILKKSDNSEVVKDAPVAAGTTEYTCNTLTENTEYTYSIVSVCGEGDESQAVTGTFKTKAAICPQASNINAVTTSAFTLTWQDATANETATEVILAPEKYHIKITTAADAATAIKDEDINTGVQTYAYTDPTANTEYTYTFHSVCADNKTSTPKTDNFTPVAADAKTLNVSLSGNQENGEYTGAVTFTFATNNFTLGEDGKVKYSIIGDKQEIEETLTAKNSVTHDLLSGDYMAEFELVDMDENSLNPKVSEEVVFTVDLPDVDAPAFSLAEQTAAFTEAQTLTLSCGTEGAKIYYAIGEADFTEYKEAINLDKSGTFTIRAFAAKEKMDTSATVSKIYTLKLPLHVPGIVVYQINFNTSQSGWTSDPKGYTQKDRDGFRFGSGSKGGSLELARPLNLMEEFTIYLQAKAYKDGENKCKVSATVNEETQTKEITDLIPNEYKEYALPFSFTSTNPEKSVSATIKVETYENSGNNRFVAKELKVYQADSTPKPQPVCNAVTNVRPKPGYGNVVFSWDQTTPAPALGFAIEIFTSDTLTSVRKDTVKTYTKAIENLTEGETYVYSITSLCAANLSSEPVIGRVTTLKKGVPHITIENPGEGRKYVTPEVTFNYRVEEFTLGTSENDSGFVQYKITGDRLAEPIIDTCTRLMVVRELEFSGEYAVEFTLVDKTMKKVEAANTVIRNFIVDLPDVDAPVFAPATTALDTATNVTLSCATDGATIYYSLNDADFTAYAQPIKLDTNGTYKFKAFAVKAKMDTSSVVSKIYTLTLPLKPVEIVGEIVFEEHFDKVPSGTGEISSDINKYTTVPGWKAVKVYQQTGGGIIKMGTGSALGSIQTPAIDLTANEGKYIVSFYAQAWLKDQNSIRLIAGNDTVDATGLVNNAATNNVSADKLSLKHYAFAFDNGTTDTKIKFEAKQASNNRFFLDSVRIYQVLPAVPTINVPATLALSTIQDQTVSQKVTVKGKLLENDVTVTCPTGNFTVSPATLPKADVMGENGAELTITFNGKKAADTVTVKLTSGSLEKEMTVTATATPITEVNTLADLQQGTQGQLYRIKGEVILTATDTYRNYKWLQDASAGIRIDDPNGLVSTTYQIGDGITGIVGKLDNFAGENQLVMVGNLPEASSHDNAINPIEVSVTDLEENMEKYAARVVKLKGLTLTNAEGNWESNKDNEATDVEDNKINIRTFVRNGNFVGTAKPQGTFDLVALAGVYKKDANTDMVVQVSPRTTEDIIAAGVEPEKDTVKTPVFTPASGTTLKPGDLITISCATDGAVIYYTLDGSTPTTASQRYTDGIKMNADKLTVKAFAVMDGMQDSKVAEASYTTPVANEDKESLNVRIYPNPNNGLFFVEAAEAVRMEIFNLSGLNLRTLELTAGKTEINLPQSGIYFIRLSNAQATIVKRVVVR